MLKIFVGFVVFAVVAVFLLIKSGADVDMGGEKHGAEAVHAEKEEHKADAASVAAPVAVPAASAASAAASAASN